MTGQQLKNSILQMAVQGKLVPQDPNDEPASVLLERIRKEKEQLIKEGKIKKEKNSSYIFRGADNLPYEKVGKNEPVCIADEVPFDIPEGWEWVRLKDIAYVNGGFAFKSPNFTDTGVRVVRISDFNEDGFVDTKIVRHTFDSSLKPFLLEEKNILLCMTGGTVGKSYFVTNLKEPMMINQRVATIKIYGAIEEYINLVIISPHTQKIIKDSKNSTNDNISMDIINSFLVPLPPLDEQNRIIEQFKIVDKYIVQYGLNENKLRKLNQSFPELLRKSILQEAVQGKLVPQDSVDEPAFVLLERIRIEKDQLIKAGKIKRDKHESVIFRRDNSHYEKCGSKEENIDDIIPFELPDSWEWIRLSAILTSTDAGKSPQCENRHRVFGEWGVIKTTAIQDGYFLAEENKVLPPNFNLQESMIVHHGDLLITRAGPRNRTGVICVVDGEPENLILSDKTVRLSYLRNFVNPHYVMTALSSPAMQYFILDAMTGMAASQVNISQEKMKTFLLPLPPLNEQQRIVDEVSKIFCRIDKLNF